MLSFQYKSFLVVTAFALSQSAAAAPDLTGNVTAGTDALYDMIVAEIASHRGDTDQAYKVLSEASRQTGSKELALAAWNAAVQTRNPDNIARETQAVLAVDPNSDPVHRYLLSDAIMKNDRDTFLRELHTIVGYSDNKPEIVAGFTLMFSHAEGNTEFIESALRPYWEQFGNTGSVQYAVSQFEQKNRKFQQACQAAKRAVDLDGDNADYTVNAANICWGSSRSTSRRLTSEFLLKHPENADVLLIQAYIHFRDGKTAEGEEQLQRAVDASPDNLATIQTAAQIALEQERPQLAEKFLRRYTAEADRNDSQIDLTSSPVWLQLAAVAKADKRPDDVVRYLSHIQSGPDYQQAKLQQAQTLADLGKPTEGAALLLEAADHADTDEPIACLDASMQILINAGLTDQAFSQLNSIVRDHPQDPDVLYDMAVFAKELGKDALAGDLIRQTLALDPDDVNANNMLGYEMVLNNGNLSEARRHLERAYRRDPLNPYVLDSLGWLSFKEGRLDQAKAFTSASLKHRFEPEVASHLIEILVQLGEKNAAMKLYRELFSRSTDTDEVRALGRRLGLTSQ